MQIEHWFYIWLIGFILTYIFIKKYIRGGTGGQRLYDFWYTNSLHHKGTWLEVYVTFSAAAIWPMFSLILIGVAFKSPKPPKFL